MSDASIFTAYVDLWRKEREGKVFNLGNALFHIALLPTNANLGSIM